ncbi:MAG: sterol desaturase family protein [Planctomycetales bacterium]|nr:sterol desaturase family protein [Planctomycetales bacterium]
MSDFISELDSSERRLGSGYVSGMLSIFLGGIGLATVLCLMYPQLLTVADARTHYNVPLIRIALHLVLIAGFLAGGISATLRRNKVLGFVGMTAVLLAALLGGSQASRRLEVESDIYFGLDFFVLNLMLLGAIFIPIERLAKKRNQPILRDDWREDLFYFFVGSLFVQSLTYLSLTPSFTILRVTPGAAGIRGAIASQPGWLQFLEIMFLTDLVQYWFHRAFHEVGWLWKFHAIHHSAKQMDWIAGSRMHFLEIVLLRTFTTLPMYTMGFAESPLYAYIFFVYLMSVFVHSNIRFHFGFLQHIIVTPRFHHWHHGVEREAININYAVHFPILDRIFGTYHMPGDRWPEGYGVHKDDVPKGFLRQFLYPFRRPPRDA